MLFRPLGIWLGLHPTKYRKAPLNYILEQQYQIAKAVPTEEEDDLTEDLSESAGGSIPSEETQPATTSLSSR